MKNNSNIKVDKIFIQIASYRDPELIPTIENCLTNADKPENLVFGICWQHGKEEDLSKYLHEPNFKIISINYTQSNGCCWARSLIQKLYDNEEYTLMLDSHHRFVKGWDTILIKMYNDLKSKGYLKPIITAYLPAYTPISENENINNFMNEDINLLEQRAMEPKKMIFSEFTIDNHILPKGSIIENHDELNEPIKSIFFSAHFAFTNGNFINEIPYDPELYFIGEEFSIVVRAFTKGYDLFHPHILIAWHHYKRTKCIKHWEDDPVWFEKDLKSKHHFQTIFDNYGIYGLGKERTIKDYIDYTELDFMDDYFNYDIFENYFDHKTRVRNIKKSNVDDKDDKDNENINLKKEKLKYSDDIYFLDDFEDNLI